MQQLALNIIIIYSTECGDCGGLLEQNGTISSPCYPKYYPHNANCTWHITVSPGLVIQFTFNSFRLEHSYNCRYDYVEVSGSITKKNGGHIEK